jgi:FAD-linked oxidoreductase
VGITSAEGAAVHWKNWAGTVTAVPARTAQPRDVDEIAGTIKAAADIGLTVRPLGSGHSFTGIGEPVGVAMDLTRWRGIVHADLENALVTVRSGTVLAELNAALHALGLAMRNLGDIDAQTIAGAISTGTHGTGARLGGIATQVVALELVLADGSVRRCSATESVELFHAARVGLGALGVLSTVTLQCVPAFVLAASERPMPIDEVIEGFDEFARANDHFEFYWFPYGAKALVKRNNRTDAGPAPLSKARQFFEYELMENRTFGALCRTGRLMPALVQPLNKLSSAALGSREYRDFSQRVFVTSRSVKFVESEYAVPRETLGAVLGELRAKVPALRHSVMFPVEVRVAAADDIWLSTAYGRDTAYVAVHQYQGMPYREYFDLFESIVDSVGGRPHWGKMHTLGAEQLRVRYPKFDEFRAVRDSVDPERRFTNPYLDRVLGT